MVYVITYDLINPGQTYPRLYRAIDQLGSWCHPVESTWFLVSALDPLTIYNHLAAVTDKNDKIIVAAVGAPGAWEVRNDEASKWLLQNLQTIPAGANANWPSRLEQPTKSRSGSMVGRGKEAAAGRGNLLGARTRRETLGCRKR